MNGESVRSEGQSTPIYRKRELPLVVFHDFKDSSFKMLFTLDLLKLMNRSSKLFLFLGEF